MKSPIKAVAFDIDGTLYPDWKLYIRLLFHFFSNFSFFHEYNEVRKELHRTAVLPNFYEYQGRLLGNRLGVSSEKAKSLIKEKVYDGLAKYFQKIKPFPYVMQVVKELKTRGIKIAILSDFPPGQKGNIWGFKDMCDVIISSEEVGALKPCVYPFALLQRALQLEAQEILYVGNSYYCDVLGASNAGMQVAYKVGALKCFFGRKPKKADFFFCDYRKLRDFVLQ